MSKVFRVMRENTTDSLSDEECKDLKQIIAQELQSQIGISQPFTLTTLSHKYNLMEQMLIELKGETQPSYLVNLYENNVITIFEQRANCDYCAIITND